MKIKSWTNSVQSDIALRTFAGLLLGAGLAPLHADVTIADFNGYGDFSYAVEYMPDIDQRRSLLPSDGSLHCAPTSTMNLFAYAANFGFPELWPGPGVWSGAASHFVMTADLLHLGTLMGTDEDGTTGSGLYQGANHWLAESSMDAMPFVAYEKGNGYWPVIDDGALLASLGGVVSFCYGRYDAEPGPDGIPLLRERNLGHCVTLQRTVADNGAVLGPRELQVRNPALPDDGDLNSNSPYSSQDLSTAANIEIARDLDEDGVFNIYPVTSLLNPPPEDGRYRVIDGFYALFPPGGMTYTEVEVAVQFSNNQLGFVQNAQPVRFQMPSDVRVLSVVPHPELHSGLALLERKGGGKMLARVPHSRGSRQSGEVVLLFSSLPADAMALVLGYGHSVFVVGQNEILHVETPGQSAHLIASAPLPKEAAGFRIEAATFNQDSHEIMLISGSQQRLFALDPATLKLKASYVLTAPFRLGGVRSLVAWGSPRGRIVAALDNRQLVQADYAPPQTAFKSWTLVPASRLLLPDVTDALSVDVDNGGRLYVADKRAGILEFTPRGTSGWQRAERPFYARFNLAGRKFAAFKSHGNIQPQLHDTPEWNNIPAEELIPLGPDIPDDTPRQ